MRQFEKLIGKNLKSLPPGKHGDGRGLYMVVEPSGARRWMFRYKSREMGLGGFPGITLARAREKAQEARVALGAGLDPIAARKAVPACVPTFGAMADLMIAKKAAEGLSKGQINGWRLSLVEYCQPIRAKYVDVITMQEVIDIVRPVIDSGKFATAERLRPRIAAVFDMAKSLGHRAGDNPAAWKGGLAYHLPSRPAATRGHHDAMPWREVPEFIANLRGRGATSAVALRFLILTGLRCSEVLGARWSEIDRVAKQWTVPATRMKKKNAGNHRVPLSEAALALLEEIAPLSEGDNESFIFPGPPHRKTGAARPLSVNVFRALMRRMGVCDATAHGFRSSFKTWALEATGFQWEVIEAALHHAVGNKVQAAYVRGDNLDKRVTLMDAWAIFCTVAPRAKDDVQPMRSVG